MFKKIVLIVCVGIFLFGIVGLSYSQQEEKDNAAPGAIVQKTEVGNKICPVSGEKINEETKATYEYQGKIYNLCCSSCIEEFGKNPQEYIKKIEAQKQAENSSQNAATEMPEAYNHMH